MPSTVAGAAVASEGKKSDTRFQRPVGLESAGKKQAIRCLQAAIESFLEAHDLSRAQLAEDLCGMSESNFSKVSHGQQGDILELIEDKLPADIREDYYERMRELKQADPLMVALKHVQLAMTRFLELSGSVPLRMAKTELKVKVRA